MDITRLIGSGDTVTKGAGNPLSSIEIFPKFISYYLFVTPKCQNIHLGETWSIKIIYVVEKMIETVRPKENDSQPRSVLDSDDENGTSACVTHSPRNSSNYHGILLAFRMLESLVGK